MKIKEYLKKYNKKLKPRTLGFLIKNDIILFGYKKRGFGQGKYKGVGGKVERGETVDEGLIREVEEEIYVTPTKFEKLVVLNFYFPYVDTPDSWNQQVHTYKITQWQGKPKESEEINPKWFKIKNIPFDSMWSDSQYWLNDFLKDRKMEASFLFGRDLKVEDYIIADLI